MTWVCELYTASLFQVNFFFLGLECMSRLCLCLPSLDFHHFYIWFSMAMIILVPNILVSFNKSSIRSTSFEFLSFNFYGFLNLFLACGSIYNMTLGFLGSIYNFEPCDLTLGEITQAYANVDLCWNVYYRSIFQLRQLMGKGILMVRSSDKHGPDIIQDMDGQAIMSTRPSC